MWFCAATGMTRWFWNSLTPSAPSSMYKNWYPHSPSPQSKPSHMAQTATVQAGRSPLGANEVADNIWKGATAACFFVGLVEIAGAWFGPFFCFIACWFSMFGLMHSNNLQGHSIGAVIICVEINQ